MVANLKKVKMDLGADILHYAVVSVSRVRVVRQRRKRPTPALPYQLNGPTFGWSSREVTIWFLFFNRAIFRHGDTLISQVKYT